MSEKKKKLNVNNINIQVSRAFTYGRQFIFHMFAKLRIYFHIEQSEKITLLLIPEIFLYSFLLQFQAKRTRKQKTRPLKFDLVLQNTNKNRENINLKKVAKREELHKQQLLSMLPSKISLSSAYFIISNSVICFILSQHIYFHLFSYKLTQHTNNRRNLYSMLVFVWSALKSLH